MINKHLIVALSVVSSALVLALVALRFPGWAHSPLPPIVMIPHTWIGKATDSSTWSDYVLGAAMLGGFISSIFLYYGSLSWKKKAAILAAGAVWGMLSWVAGAFPVIAGLWMVIVAIYVTKRFDEENRRRSQERKFFTIGGQRWEAMSCLLLGPAFSVGLKYGFGQAWVHISMFTGMAFVVPAAIGELFYGILKITESTSSETPTKTIES